MGSILEVAAILAIACSNLSCDGASLRSCFIGLSTREASAEVGQLFRCRRVRHRCKDTNGLSRYLWPQFWWSYVPAKAVQGRIFDRSRSLAYKLFYRLPVKHPVPFIFLNSSGRHWPTLICLRSFWHWHRPISFYFQLNLFYSSLLLSVLVK